MELTRDETRLLAALDDDELVRSLVDLVRVPSVTGTAEESELQHRQAVELGRAGFDVDTWALDLDALRAHPNFPGTEAERVEGYGVVATSAAREPGVPALVLQGHVDVVPVGDPARWGADPFGAAVTAGPGGTRVLHGRGACDMKAGVAANLAVARTLHASGARLERPLAVHTVVSEEDGGLGAFATLVRGHTGAAAVITEPTAGRLVTATAGALTFRIAVRGRAAHGATRSEGVSAVDAFWPLATALRELEGERNAVPDRLFDGNPLPYPISVGTIRAGDWPSSVPDLLVAEGRLGVRLGEEPAAARADFEERVRAACARDAWLRDHPATVTWPGGQFASGRTVAGHGLVDEMGAAARAVSGGPPPRPGAAPYGSDLRLYAAAGIPTLHYGPGDVRLAHAPRERVDLAEVVDVTRALLVLTARRCGLTF